MLTKHGHNDGQLTTCGDGEGEIHAAFPVSRVGADVMGQPTMGNMASKGRATIAGVPVASEGILSEIARRWPILVRDARECPGGAYSRPRRVVRQFFSS
jgi:hypothetical protein